MKIEKIGQFKTDGSMIVTDPCYEELKDSYKLSVKPGIYEASVLTGKVKNGFGWDKLPGSFRVAELMIVHSAYKGPKKFKKVYDGVGVDSGQAGFFNKKNFYKKYHEKVEMLGERYDFFKREILENQRSIKQSKNSLKLEESCPKFKSTLEFIKSKENTIKYYHARIEDCKKYIAETKKAIKTNNYPEYYQPMKTDDFYDLMCDLTCQQHYSGVMDFYGTVSRAGYGDGVYNLFVAKDEKGKVIAAKIIFLDKKDLKK